MSGTDAPEPRDTSEDPSLLVPDEQAWSVYRQAGHPVLGALSPSRAGDFTTCPLLYRYRAIDRLPEPPSTATARGTLVHSVLEQLFDLPSDQRVLDTAVDLLPETWRQLLEEQPELAEVLDDEVSENPRTLADWLREAEPLLRTYFAMEDPRLLEPAQREVHVECQLPEGPVLRGFIDRVDVAPGVGMRIVDYKTGRAPGQGFEQKAMFQLRFYALVVWRMTGVIPRLLQLTYLGSGHFLRFEPTEGDLISFEHKVRALWRAILQQADKGEWPARPGRLCQWCSFHAYCPAQGGVLLPLPQVPPPSDSGTVVS